MEDLSVYHRAIGKEEGERRLAQDGRDGCYLIRDSETMAGVYCLCVLCKGFIFTYRLRLDVKKKVWTADTADGVKKRRFRTIGNLIAAFKKPDQGIMIPLCFPLGVAAHQSRSAAPRAQRGQGEVTGACPKAPAAAAGGDAPQSQWRIPLQVYKICCKKK